MLGAAPEELRELAKTMSLSGQDLDNTATSLQAAVTRTQWSGFDADSFRNRWASALRPTLRTAGASLENMSKMLLAQADEQEKASADTGGSGGPGDTGSSGSAGTGGSDGGPQISTPGDSPTGESLDGAFTDPGYVPAPGGLEWLTEDVLGIEDGAQAQGVTNALKFAADKFAFNISLADGNELAAMMPKFSNAMDVGGRALGVVGVGLGIADVASGMAHGDGFRAADGVVSTVLSAAAIAATTSVVGAPLGVAIGAVGLLWGAASMLSGDIPVTKRIVDGIGWLGGLVGIK